MPRGLSGSLSSGDMASVPKIFTELPCDLPEKLFTTLLQAPGIHIERIVSQGQCSPDGFWYDQDQAEFDRLKAPTGYEAGSQAGHRHNRCPHPRTPRNRL